MAETISEASGSVRGRNRFTSPQGLIRNFSKFQATRPALP